MTEPGKLARTSIPVRPLKSDEALVEVKGCGVCHTDISYYYMGVPTEQKPPLTLGHEISGVVVAGPANLVGKEVIVPAVMPCNNCDICRSGRSNRCLGQKMPGNSLGIYGGFASHIPVPAADLCVVGDRKGMPLEWASVIADAVTTPYQAALRGRIQAGDRVIVIGAAGGVGSFMTQIAKAMGASTVIGIDINDEKLKMMEKYGADFTINPKGKSVKEMREVVKACAKEHNIPHNRGWKIFEVTGTKAGQETCPHAIVLCRHTGRGGLRDGSDAIHALQADGLRRRDHRHLGLPAQVLRRRAAHVHRGQDRARAIRGNPADEPDRKRVRRGAPPTP